MAIINYKKLKLRQRIERDKYSNNAGLRIHRALSWLNKAEKSEGDLDTEFIFLWITFNAAYAGSMNDANIYSEKERLEQFIAVLCELDKDKKIENLIWNEFSSSIRVLLDNKYVFQPFWNFQNQYIDEDKWTTEFAAAKRAAASALGNKDTATILGIVFSRLYTMRNQLLHGGATWNSKVNRDQMRDSTNFIRKIVPIIIEIMMNYSHRFNNQANYPVVD